MIPDELSRTLSPIPRKGWRQATAASRDGAPGSDAGTNGHPPPAILDLLLVTSMAASSIQPRIRLQVSARARVSVV